MKNALLLVGGGLLGYGLWLYYKKGKLGTGNVSAQPKIIRMTETTQIVYPGNPMVQSYDARPEVLFAPPLVYVEAAGAGSTDNVSQALIS